MLPISIAAIDQQRIWALGYIKNVHCCRAPMDVRWASETPYTVWYFILSSRTLLFGGHRYTLGLNESALSFRSTPVLVRGVEVRSNVQRAYLPLPLCTPLILRWATACPSTSLVPTFSVQPAPGSHAFTPRLSYRPPDPTICGSVLMFKRASMMLRTCVILLLPRCG